MFPTLKRFARPSSSSSSSVPGNTPAPIPSRDRVLAWLFPRPAVARDCEPSVDMDSSSSPSYSSPDIFGSDSPSDTSSSEASTPGSSVESLALPATAQSPETSDLARLCPDLFKVLSAPAPKAVVVDSHTDAFASGPRRSRSASLTGRGLGLSLDANPTISYSAAVVTQRRARRRHVANVAPIHRSRSAASRRRSHAPDLDVITEDSELASAEPDAITAIPTTIVTPAASHSSAAWTSSRRSVATRPCPQRRVSYLSALAEEIEPASTPAARHRRALTIRPRPHGRVFDTAVLAEELVPKSALSFAEDSHGILLLVEPAAELICGAQPLVEEHTAASSLPSPYLLHSEWQSGRALFHR
jgi:hypothetical protein